MVKLINENNAMVYDKHSVVNELLVLQHEKHLVLVRTVKSSVLINFLKGLVMGKLEQKILPNLLLFLQRDH